MHIDSHLHTFVHTIKSALSSEVHKSRVISFASLQPHANVAKSFTLSDKELDLIHSLRYLGVLLCKSGSFHTNIKEQFQRATNAMYDYR
jgi:hypothetical protein